MNNGKICASVCAETADEMIAKIKQAEQFADVIEVRFDCLSKQVFRMDAKVETPVWEQILSSTAKPILSTYRPRSEGGYQDLTEKERLTFWYGGMETAYADVEDDIADEAMTQLFEEYIISRHDFDGVPVNLEALFDRLASVYLVKIVKVAAKANDVMDAIPIWHLLDRAHASSKGIIPIAMGDAGKWTRILGLAHGAYMTYASLEAGDETAPGQVTARDLVEVYRVKELDKNTQVFGVIGDPVAQSLSPYMHNPAFVDRGVNAVFLHFLVKNIDEFIRRMVRSETREVELNFGGFSVTMPHKQAIIPHLDAIDPTAKVIGAVNTVKIDDGKLTGYNTDAHGFITPLKAKFGDVKDARVVVFGAGGAARACVYALKQEGADVTVFARDAVKGAAFAEEFGVKFSEISNFKSEISNPKSEISDLKFEFSDKQDQNQENQESQRPKTENQKSKTVLSNFDILVDATPLGMKGPFENDSLFTADELNELKFVYDLVTKTTDTPLIAEAKKAGIPAIGGLDMLIAQGCKQFEIWTGLEAPAELMRDSLVARMSK